MISRSELVSEDVTREGGQKDPYYVVSASRECPGEEHTRSSARSEEVKKLIYSNERRR